MRAHHQFLNFMTALFVAALIITSQYAALGNDGITLSKTRIHGASVCVIAVDLNDPSLMVDIGLPQKGITHHEAFGSFVKRRAPLAAVTGTYFDMRTLTPTGSIVIDGKVVHVSHIGTAVCFMSDNKVKFIEAGFGEACDLAGAQCGLRTGPRLLAGGQYALNPRREGFRHPGLFGARIRMALGVTADNKLLLVFVGTPVNFSKLASIMKALHSMDAVCLDGGTSSAMYFKGRMVRKPGRMLTNLIEVYRRPLPLPTAKTAKVMLNAMRPPAHWRTIPVSTDTPSRHESETTYVHTAIMCDMSWLRFTKGVHTLFPINRT